MKKRVSSSVQKSRKRTPRRKAFHISENLLVFFPKTSQMGVPDPSQWGQASTLRKSDTAVRLPAFSSSIW
jgi:hypothetical protein